MVYQTLELRWWEAVQKQDDRSLFNRLYLKHWEALYIIAWNRTKDEDVAKDIVQDVFINFWERRKHIVIRTSVIQYLTGALKNRLIDYFQSEQVKRRVFEYVLQQMGKVIWQSDNAAAYQEVEDAFDETLNAMPENMRKSLLLRLENQSISDIAKQLNLAEQTVSNLHTEAGKRLRKKMLLRLKGAALPITIVFLQTLNDLLINR